MKFFKVVIYIFAFVIAVYMAVFFNSYYLLVIGGLLAFIACCDFLFFLLPFGKVETVVWSNKTDYTKGETGKIYVKIKSSKIYPIYKVSLDLAFKNKFYDEEKIKIETSVPAIFGKKIILPLHIEKSGIINIAVSNIEYSDMFGILKRKSKAETKYSVIAMPNEIEINNIEYGVAESDEIPATNVYLSNEGDVSGYREYHEGDRKNNINWKIFARSENLYVKEFERTSADEAVILLDMNIKNIDKAMDILYSVGKYRNGFTLLWLPCGNEEFETAYIADEETLKATMYKIFSSSAEVVENKGLYEYKRIYRENKVLYISDKMELI